MMERSNRRARLMRIGVIALMVFAGRGIAAAADEQVDWGPQRVATDEWWPGAMAGWNWQDWQPGIGLWRLYRTDPGSAIMDYRQGWMAEGNDGRGVAGMWEGQFDGETRLEVEHFGRRDGQIHLIMVARRGADDVPNMVQTAVGPRDARTVGPAGRLVFFAGMFPEDLPAGEYRVIAELRGPDGEVQQRYETRLVRPQERVDPLAELTDEQLLAEYVRRGEALRGMSTEPTDYWVGRVAWAGAYANPPHMAWRAAHGEIVRRGEMMVPLLMELLEREAVRNPGEVTHLTAPFGLAFDVMRMLQQTDDPRPVGLLVRIMEGMDGRANTPVRQMAMETAARFTRVNFVVQERGPVNAFAMMDERALRIEGRIENHDPSLKGAAGLYRRWLAEEGGDPADWLPLARQRARVALEGNDPLAVRNAVEFLTGGFHGGGHDDDPQRTIDAIIHIMQREDQTVIEQNRGVMNLHGALAGYGPLARPHVDLLIEHARQRPTWSSFANLCAVGGEQAVAYMVEALPRLRVAAEQLGADLDHARERVSDMDARQLASTYHACRWGIERWAGRTFANDDAIAVWWAEAGQRSQQQWLEENMQRTAAEADAGSAKAQFIIRQVLPDLPHAEDDLPFLPPWTWRVSMTWREYTLEPFRVEWLRANRPRLEYDPRRSCFVLAPPAG